jgi:hypothetical protein
MSGDEAGRAGSRGARAERGEPWRSAQFWSEVEAELGRVEPGDFARFALPVRVSRELEQELWKRIEARLAQGRASPPRG